MIVKFLGWLLTPKINVEEELEKNPELKESMKRQYKLAVELDKKLEKIKEKDPKRYAKLKAQGRTNYVKKTRKVT